ncbi:MAG: aminotransferase class V-fold PLP-dependent enzyme, partial [Spirochaetaceae bacterium]|nr:aminotransferase class V-fold PLP-dependent enzyme [Spirochaetaceae bacterium]
LCGWAGRDNFFVDYSSQCHPSVLYAIDDLHLETQVLEVDSQGCVIFPKFWKGPKKPLLIYSIVNHETGGIENPKRLQQWVRQWGGWIMADAIQAFPRSREDLWLPYCDLFVISGHKFHVPKGIALLSGPLLKEMEMESLEHQMLGTQDVALQYVFSRGVEKLLEQRESINQSLRVQEEEAIYYWNKMGLKYTLLSPVDKVPGVINIALNDKVDMEDLFLYLASRYISISRFCACKGTVKGASEILLAQGISEEDARQSLRISGGRFNKREDWLNLGRELVNYLRKNRKIQ